MSVPFMWVDGNLTVILKNKAHQVIPDHTNYKVILEALPTATEDELLELVDIEKAVATFSQGQVSIQNGKVMFEGEEVHGSISKRILEFMSKGLPFEPLVKFLENLMENQKDIREIYKEQSYEELTLALENWVNGNSENDDDADEPTEEKTTNAPVGKSDSVQSVTDSFDDLFNS